MVPGPGPAMALVMVMAMAMVMAQVMVMAPVMLMILRLDLYRQYSWYQYCQTAVLGIQWRLLPEETSGIDLR